MSEVKLNLIDAERVLHGTIHGSMADACVAALSAAPETISEVEAALARYVKPNDSESYFASFRSIHCPTNFSLSSDKCEPVIQRPAIDKERWDAGIVVIDLAARIVASESSYSQPGPEGEVFYHDGHETTDVPVLYRVPDDWLFVNSVDAYQWSRERRIQERTAKPAIDARAILLGRPLLQFIVNAYLSLPATTWSAFTETAESATPDDEGMPDDLARESSIIHARWLLTPREDLRGQSPRDVLLAQQDYIDFDLHARSVQWSLQNEGPPCLNKNSFAYRFAAFGTHEWVLYYDLVRYLIRGLIDLKPDAIVSTACGPGHVGQSGCSAGNRRVEQLRSLVDSRASATVDTAFGGGQVDELIVTLEQIKTDWLESPQSDFDGRIPAVIIDNERKRLPEAMRARDMIVDDDCPMCRMLGDETSPMGMGVGFWHLDGSHMDDDFAFSSFKTRQEWEAENRRREEFRREFEREQEERRQRLARGETGEPDPFIDPETLDLKSH